MQRSPTQESDAVKLLSKNSLEKHNLHEIKLYAENQIDGPQDDLVKDGKVKLLHKPNSRMN